MLNSKHAITVLTVTYGNRWPFLQQVLSNVLAYNCVTQVVIVDNASVYSVADKVNEIGDARVQVITNTDNEGSAGGYHAAIQYAAESNKADLIWLLDDDNSPSDGVPETLLNEWAQIDAPDNKKALFCLRDDRATHVNIAKGENPYRYYLVPDNFLGFNVFRMPVNWFNKFRDKLQKRGPYLSRVKMPYVPYGGLLFHQSMVKTIGLPNAAMFLYVDDSEYSYRITQNGGTIWLIPSCRIVDLERSQGIGYRRKLFHSKLLDQWSFRNYYHVRNRMYFYSRVAIKSKIAFKINKTLYLTYLQIVSLLSSKVNQYHKLLQAVDDGLKGNLGKADKNRF